MYRSNETLTDVNSLPYDQANGEASQTESQYAHNLNLQLNLAVQEKEAATEMLKLSQMTLNNLETVLDERRKAGSVEYIKTVKAEYSEAIQLLNEKIELLSNQVSSLREEKQQYKALTQDLESDNHLLREKNVELENELSHHIKRAEDILCRDRSHESNTQANAKEKEELERQLKLKELENVKLREKCADVEQTASQMEETLRNSEAKLKELRKRDATHLEAIASYVKDIHEMKDRTQVLKLKLQDQELESKKQIFDMQQDMTLKISSVTNENSVLQRMKAGLENEVSQLSQSIDQLTSRLAQFQMSTVPRETHDIVLDQLTDMKQQKLFHQHESARVKNELECLSNEHTLLLKSLTGKVHLLESQLISLQNSSQQLTEDNIKYVQELTPLRSQLYFYHKLFENNSLLAAVEKYNSLTQEKNTQLSELDSYVDKYRDQVKSWKNEYEKMAARFKKILERCETENKTLRAENVALRKQHYHGDGIKCKIKTGADNT
uniref:Uncharacterized protein n=1 Tax=Cacopsylla melanoneura TaxID=428564 RepID=A0A8D8Q4A5_9HEMI